MASSSDYAATLRELEQMHNNGVIDDSAYEVHKAKIIAESSTPPRSAGVRILTGAGLVILALILARIIIAVLVAFTH